MTNVSVTSQNLMSQDDVMWSVNLFLSISYTIVLMAGIIGNFLVIFTITHVYFPKPQGLNTTQMFLLNLACADVFFLLFYVPVQLVVCLVDRWALGRFMCHFHVFCETCTMYASAWTLVALAIDRYFAIVHALKQNKYRTKRNGYIGIAIIWFISISFAVSAIFTKTYVTVAEIKTQMNKTNFSMMLDPDESFCLETEDKWNHDIKNENITITDLKIANAVYAYLVPVLIILMCYMAVIRKLYLKHRNSSVGRNSGSTLNKVTRTVCVLIAVFMVDWLMYHAVKIVAIYSPQMLGGTHHFVMQTSSTLLASSNSAVNPLVYAFSANEFRGDFCKATGIPAIKTSKRFIHGGFSFKKAAKDLACFMDQCATNVTSPGITPNSLLVDPRRNSNCLGIFPDSRMDTEVTYKTSPRL